VAKERLMSESGDPEGTGVGGPRRGRSRRSTDEEHGRGRADELRRAAARIFYEKGYDATSIHDIAEAVGMLKGSVYYYIDAKEDLLFDVINEAHERGLALLETWESLDVDALTRLRLAIEGHVRNNLEHHVDVGVFFHDFRSLSPGRRADIIKNRDLYDDYLRQTIVAGQAEGSIDPDVDPKLATMAILGVMNWVYQWYRADGPDSPERIATQFSDLLISGLATRNDGTPRSALGTTDREQRATS
jgi:TetR/AcrR family transcriptional regulator, cholesterol catabolism regulator